MDFDPAFALFVNCPTVASLREYLGGSAPADADLEVAAEAPVVPACVEYSIDDIVEAILETNDPHLQELSQQPLIHQATRASTALSSSDNAAFDTALKIIAEESGVAIEDFTEETAFADIGKKLAIESILTDLHLADTLLSQALTASALWSSARGSEKS